MATLLVKNVDWLKLRFVVWIPVSFFFYESLAFKKKS